MTSPQYRLFFNEVSVVLMIFIMFCIIETPSDAVFNRNHFVFGIGCGFVVASFLVFKMAFKHINLSAFLGFSAADESTGLITEGLYAVIRHPLYFGTTILLVGVFLILPTWTVSISVLLSMIYIVVGIEFEERKLRQIFGSAYDDFARGKKKFIPFIY
jgi:protein-S-isoprenylcysteine O-methyltransferase Ste14